MWLIVVEGSLLVVESISFRLSLGMIIRKLSMIRLTDVAAALRVWPELMISTSIKWELGWSRRLRKFLIEE